MSTVWQSLYCPWVYKDEKIVLTLKQLTGQLKKKKKRNRKSPCVFKCIRNKFYLAKEEHCFQMLYNSNGHFPWKFYYFFLYVCESLKLYPEQLYCRVSTP